MNRVTLSQNPPDDLPAHGQVDLFYNHVTEQIEAEDWEGNPILFRGPDVPSAEKDPDFANLISTYPLRVPVRSFADGVSNSIDAEDGPATLSCDGLNVFGSGTMVATSIANNGLVYTTPTCFEPLKSRRNAVSGFSSATVAVPVTLLAYGVNNATYAQVNATTPLTSFENSVMGTAPAYFGGGSYIELGTDKAAILYPRVKSAKKICIYFHGAGNDVFSHLADAADGNSGRMRTTIKALLNDGWIVASFNGGSNPNHWGNNDSWTAVNNLVDWLKSNFPGYKITALGQSMGGNLSVRAYTQIPVISRWYGIFPVLSLGAMYDLGTYSAQINSAYGTSDRASMLTASVNNDSIRLPLPNFAGKSFRMIASAGDTVVPKASNADAFATRITGTAASVIVDAHTGDHGDPSAFNPSSILSWFNV